MSRLIKGDYELNVHNGISDSMTDKAFHSTSCPPCECSCRVYFSLNTTGKELFNWFVPFFLSLLYLFTYYRAYKWKHINGTSFKHKDKCSMFPFIFFLFFILLSYCKINVWTNNLLFVIFVSFVMSTFYLFYPFYFVYYSVIENSRLILYPLILFHFVFDSIRVHSKQ